MRFKLFILTLFLFSAVNLFAQSHSTEIGGQTDDDSYLFQGFDRYYTAGTYFYYRHALTVKNSGNTALCNKVLGFEIGQALYTPQSGSIANNNGIDQPGLVDRPFAAYLYIGSTLNFLYKDESNLKLSGQIGVVGPDALGKQAIDFIHNNFGFYHPSGWEYQVDNSFELNLSAQYNKLLIRPASWIDVSAESYVNLGFGFTGAGAGALIRIGNFNQLFNSVSTQSTTIRNNDVKPLHQHEFFFYYKPLVNYVAYDATIQGSLFGRNPNSEEITLDKEPFVFSQEFGVGITTNRFVIILYTVQDTKNVREMVDPDSWGSIALFYRFK
ncbi:MAG TPA: lipid A deacylase LpxR family protein [Mucilaginibacter sp.]|jgi:hypothetical protein|nr:lipid A deacylase LpxR family protein [Mucilaginibacter sp.]